MLNTLDRQKERPERALLVAVHNHQQQEAHTLEMLGELTELAQSSGLEVVDRMTVRVRGPQSRLLMGKGKAEEVAARCRELEVELLVFDDSLNPGQQRNWEELAKIPVIDRQEVILDIFGQRASTREAELQIELARAEYLLPRLKRAWTHLHRQPGAVGVRGGEGEKQLEIDNRLLRRRITKLKSELKKVRKRRAEQRKKRQGVPVANAAIVGYTNCGKSSLLNLLTKAEATVGNKLFATLDPTTRRLKLPNKQTLLLTDTVGFVRKLPHNLVEAFKATLEEAALADFLVHMVDVNSLSADEHMQTTLEVLEEIGAGGKESIVVFNKIDLAEAYLLRRRRRRYPAAEFISAKTGEGIESLVGRLSAIVAGSLKAMKLHLPLDKYAVLAFLHRTGHVLEETYEDDGIYVTASVPGKCRRGLEKYLVP